MDEFLGPYRLGPNDTPENGIYTGDCLALLRAIPGSSVDLVVTDPPYNAGKDYGPLVDDNLTESAYLGWYERWATECFRLTGNGYLYVSCTTPQLWTLRPLWEKTGFAWVMMCIWWGPNYAGNSNTIRQQWRLLYEPIMLFLKGERVPMLNNVRGLNSDAVMRYTRPQRSFSGDLRRIHPTQKPVALYRNIIGRTPGEFVLDPFVGSGTTVMAAKMLGRRYLAFEIDPDVAETARQRVRETQPPLPMQMPVQRELMEDREAVGGDGT